MSVDPVSLAALAPAAGRPGGSRRGDVWRRFRRNHVAVVALGFLGLLLVVAILAPVVAPYGITDRVASYKAPPSRAHLFGTDAIGRDVFSSGIL